MSILRIIMRSATLNRIIFFCTIIIFLVVSAQLYWLYRIYKADQRNFTVDCIRSLKWVYEDLSLSNEPDKQLQKLISQPDPNTFICQIDSIPPKDTLIYYINKNMEDYELFTDCNIAVYDKGQKKYVYQVYLAAVASHDLKDSSLALPAPKAGFSYIHLFFPHRKKYIFSEMKWWIISAVIVLSILITLSGSLLYLYKQKFLNEEQADFIKNVTHEFQTPLTTLQLGLDYFSKLTTADSPAKIKQYVVLMLGQVQYLKQHIENLASASKSIERKDRDLFTSVVPNRLVEQAVSQLHLQIEEKKATVQLALDPEHTTITADSTMLLTAIVNIISNALKYASDPDLQIVTKRENGHFVIMVKDNGVGIEKKYQKRLFRKFYRVPSGDTHTVKGLGLGLYFVKKSMDAHNGEVTLTSTPGMGTQVKLILPVNE